MLLCSLTSVLYICLEEHVYSTKLTKYVVNFNKEYSMDLLDSIKQVLERNNVVMDGKVAFHVMKIIRSATLLDIIASDINWENRGGKYPRTYSKNDVELTTNSQSLMLRKFTLTKTGSVIDIQQPKSCYINDNKVVYSNAMEIDNNTMARIKSALHNGGRPDDERPVMHLIDDMINVLREHGIVIFPSLERELINVISNDVVSKWEISVPIGNMRLYTYDNGNMTSYAIVKISYNDQHVFISNFKVSVSKYGMKVDMPKSGYIWNKRVGSRAAIYLDCITTKRIQLKIKSAMKQLVENKTK